MKPSRNDPCPCGSGRKYKACCQPRDQGRAQARAAMGEEAFAETEARVAEAARRAPRWEADVVPLSVRFRNDRDAAPGLAMVTAAGYVLHGDTLAQRPVGPAARAEVLVRAVSGAARVAGVFPEALRVRDGAVAAAAEEELARRGIRVETGPMPELDEALDSALEHLGGGPQAAIASMPLTWGETEASDAEVAALFSAAAGYHRAAPWETMGDSETLLLWFPGEEEPWAATVMGGAGVTRGLAIYSDPGDAENILSSAVAASADVLLGFRGMSLSLTYDAASDLPRQMRREVAAADWEVAAPDAHPMLMAIRAPERRVTTDHVRRVTAALRAVTAAAALPLDEDPWTHPETGIRLAWMFEEEDADFGFDDDESGPFPFGPVERLSLIGPEGPNADPEAVLAPAAERATRIQGEEEARLDRFIVWNAARTRSRAAREREERIATEWFRFLVASDLPAGAVTEFDIRTFLYKVLVLIRPLPKQMGRHVTDVMRLLFLFLETEEGIRYPTGAEVLRELDVMATELETDLRETMEVASMVTFEDLVGRAQFHHLDVPGTRDGWTGEAPEVGDLRVELHRRWLLWHDEVVRSGIDLPEDVRDVLVGRQRAWENTPHPGYDGRTPKQVVLDSERGGD